MSNRIWFDEKYNDGRKPTTDDKIELFRQLNLPRISNRISEAVEKKLAEALFQLNGNSSYRPSLEVVAHGLLYCLSPMLDWEKSKFEKYDKMYKRAITKHKQLGTRILTDNFEE